MHCKNLQEIHFFENDQYIILEPTCKTRRKKNLSLHSLLTAQMEDFL